jgi:hypothetical protein
MKATREATESRLIRAEPTIAAINAAPTQRAPT